MKPRGGTELQLEFLHKYCKKELLDKVNICTSIPGKVPLVKDKINILWQNLDIFLEFHKTNQWLLKMAWKIFQKENLLINKIK